jgi:hypothetical protein
MNFNDLYRKIQAIDEGAVVECGMPMQQPEQQDSVTMNVSMNGSGAGGIKDLMNILKNIEDAGSPQDGDDVVIDNEGFEDATTKPNEVTLDIDSVIPTGNDLASKGGEAEKVNGGGNPMQRDIDEALVSKLSAMYEAVKEKEPEGLYSKKRHETDGQRIARLAKEKRQAEKKERMKNDFNAEMERE